MKCVPSYAAVVPWLATLVTAVHAQPTGTISGAIVDEKGQATFVGNAVVFLCDADSGLPILKTTRQPLALDRPAEGFKDFWTEMTTDRGDFEFQSVPTGRYRLVAQSWTGIRGMPDFFQFQPSTVVVLHGVADHVLVKGNETSRAYLKTLGDGVLKIVNDPEEPHAFLLVSRKPRLGDGVLGPAAWGPAFLSGLIGVTQMERPYVTFLGLPDGEEIHVGLLNYDNNPGVGGDSFTVGQQRTVRLPIYATWSNGKYEPPPRLAALTDYLDEHNVTSSEILGLTGSDEENRQTMLTMLRDQPDRQVEVPDTGSFRLADVLAAEAYQRLRRQHRSRNDR